MPIQGNWIIFHHISFCSGMFWLLVFGVVKSSHSKKSPPLKEPNETIPGPTRTLKACLPCVHHIRLLQTLFFVEGSDAGVGTHQGKKGSTDMLIFGGPCDVWKKHDTLGFLNFSHKTASKQIQRGTRSISTISLK